MNWGLILLILLGALNIAALALLSVRHWRGPETERILPMRGSTRKFVRRVIALLTAEILALMLLVSALSYALTLDNTVMMEDGDRIAGNLENLYFSPRRIMPGNYVTSLDFASFIAENGALNPFWTTQIQCALFRQEDRTQVAEYWPGTNYGHNPSPLRWIFYGLDLGEVYGIEVDKGVPMSFDNASNALLPPESRPMPPALAGLLRFLYPIVKGDDLRLPARGNRFDGTFRFAIKALLIPMDNEETQARRKTSIAPHADTYGFFLTVDPDDLREELVGFKERYGITEEKIEEMRMTPIFDFLAMGSEDVDTLLSEDPALMEHIYIYYGEGGGTSLFRLFLFSPKTQVLIVLLSILLFYLLALAAFVDFNARQMGRREKLLLQRERDLLRDVAHELKTPLGVTRLLAEKIQLESDPLEKDKAAGQLTGKVDAMNAAVMKNLNASRLETLDEPLAREEFSLRDMALALAEDNAVLLEEKGQRLRTAGMEGDIIVSADPVRMEEAITNLLSNAVRYAPAGSEITLRLGQARHKAVFSLRNDCEAIPAKELRALWEPYVRLQRDKDSGVKGTGLGLAIVRNIVTLHSGRYGAKNVPGGVEFWFEIPNGRAG